MLTIALGFCGEQLRHGGICRGDENGLAAFEAVTVSQSPPPPETPDRMATVVDNGIAFT
jgi:hypothetical protein